MNIFACTFTGIDETTDRGRLKELSARFPFLEWGVLLSFGRAGLENRYPAIRGMIDISERLSSDIPLAMHICGADTMTAFLKDMGHAGVLASYPYRRFQMNFRADKFTHEMVTELMLDYPQRQYITQHNSVNRDLWKQIRLPNHSVLFDSSGGAGKLPEGYESPLPGKTCGYAGGLGPENILERLAMIQAAAGDHSVWVDMEGRIRTADDRIDLDKCEAVALAVEPYYKAKPAPRAKTAQKMSL